jgi:GntR family transcriptional repressor for pyruvate dehydrogenase complex
MSVKETPKTDLIRKHTRTKMSITLSENLRAAIVKQAFTPGARLPSEERLMEQSGHSRATVREALRVLEHDGLIEIRRRPSGGLFVRRPDHACIARSLRLLLEFNRNDPHEVLEARREFETLCARLAAARISDQDLGRLRASVERLEQTVDSREAARENLVFHLTVVEATGNSVLQIIVAAVRSLLYEGSVKIYYSRENVLEAVRAHRRITDALSEGNPTLAASRMLKHLMAFERFLVDTGQIDRLLHPSRVSRHTVMGGVKGRGAGRR